MPASLYDRDGIPIEVAPETEGHDLPVEFSGLLPQIGAAAQCLGAGGLKEVIVRAEDSTWAFRILDSSACFSTQPAADSVGRARFSLRMENARFERLVAE